MTESGKMVNLMVEEYTLLKMGLCMMENLRMEKDMEGVY